MRDRPGPAPAARPESVRRAAAGRSAGSGRSDVGRRGHAWGNRVAEPPDDRLRRFSCIADLAPRDRKPSSAHTRTRREGSVLLPACAVRSGRRLPGDRGHPRLVRRGLGHLLHLARTQGLRPHPGPARPDPRRRVRLAQTIADGSSCSSRKTQPRTSPTSSCSGSPRTSRSAPRSSRSSSCRSATGSSATS